jgi:peptide/nickel transport system substrate-binding protein
MDRRHFLKTTAGGLTAGLAAGIATPAISQRAAARTLRLVPHADVANFDPVLSIAYIVRNASALVFDMLYGVDAKLRPQRQMIESEEVSSDGLIWTFRLRPGLRFHDGEPVLAKDVVASINRWAVRNPMGQMIKARENELVAVDDRSFRWSLNKPFPKMLLALGKLSPPCCFIMPARIAATDSFKPIGEHIGSGPMRFVRNEWVPGARVVFEKFADYVPRPEPASWFAGGKRMLVDRMEWVVIPDPATAAAALQSGEVDWWELALPDLIPTLRRNRNVAVDISDPLGWFGFLLLNHRYPPFNDVRARRALLMAISQEDFMRAYVGDDDSLRKTVPGYFTPGTPLYTEEGGEIVKGPRNIDAARKLLAESGYAGQPVTCMAAQDMAHHKSWGDVTADLLRRLGVNVDFVAADWGTVVARRGQKAAPGRGGWNMYPTSYAGADCLDPTNGFMQANGTVSANGWANIPQVTAEIAAWYEARNPEEEKAVVRRLNKAALDNVVYAPLGFYLRHQAWHKNVAGIVQGPLPFCWGVSKTV